MDSHTRLRMLPFLTGLFVVLGAHLVQAQSESAQPSPGDIWILQIEDAIGPATSDYIERGIERANENGASLIVITQNTPGGLDPAMRSIISAILASKVPVASYVTPQGARAASAGTYIAYASHFSVMNDATNLGAATPVQIGTPSAPSPPSMPGPESEEGEESEQDEQDTGGMTAMEKKMVNDAAAYIRGLAELRGRNAEWAEEAVRQGVSLSASEALEANVIDFIASDIEDLIAQVDKQTVEIEGNEITLDLAGKAVYEHKPDWRTELLATLTNPNMVLILGMFGVYGILLEFYNPGSLIPGVVGVICLILAGYALQMLPVNYAGLALIAVGLGLMVAEAMAPSFGILGIGGVIAFIIGGVMLFDSEMEAFQVGIPVLAASGAVLGLLIVATVTIAVRMRKQKVTTGIDTIVGQHGAALSEISGQGQVRIAGEIWRANAPEPIASGTRVVVTGVDGMVLTVEPA